MAEGWRIISSVHQSHTLPYTSYGVISLTTKSYMLVPYDRVWTDRSEMRQHLATGPQMPMKDEPRSPTHESSSWSGAVLQRPDS